MSETLTWLITGASRGIGLETVRQLLQVPENLVIATCREPAGATELHTLKEDAKGVLHIVALDVSSSTSIEAAKQPVIDILGERGLDYLINNAAINIGMDTAFSFTEPNFLQTLTTNLVGPAHLSQTLLPLLEKSSKKFILNLTSSLGSMGLDAGKGWMTYSVSKAAIGMLTYKQARERPDFTVICIDPGWVRTSMGGQSADLAPEDSVKQVLDVVASSTLASSGKFFHHTGKELPW